MVTSVMLDVVVSILPVSTSSIWMMYCRITPFLLSNGGGCHVSVNEEAVTNWGRTVMGELEGAAKKTILTHCSI